MEKAKERLAEDSNEYNTKCLGANQKILAGFGLNGLREVL
jgi:hypothetical protein